MLPFVRDRCVLLLDISALVDPYKTDEPVSGNRSVYQTVTFNNIVEVPGRLTGHRNVCKRGLKLAFRMMQAPL